MKIQNKTQKMILSEDATLCPSLLQKARGLMFCRQRDLVFVEKKERRIPLHMWFVFYPIDIVYCDKDKKIVEIKENFCPWAFYSPKNKAMYVLELRAGIIEKTKTQVNDALAFVSQFYLSSC